MNKYWISEAHFSLNESFFNKDNPSSKIQPTLSQSVKKIDKNNAEVVLKLDINDDQNIPFEIHVSINGFFECNDWERNKKQNKLLLFTSVQTLYPYLRQAVSNLTSMANIAPYTLPIINVYSFLNANQDADN